MKKVIFLIVTLVSIMLVSCGDGSSRPASPKVFNDTAINAFKEADKTLDGFDAKVTEAVKSNNLPSIAGIADDASAEVDAQLNKMNAIIPPQGGEEYKDAVLKGLEKIKEMIEIGRKYSTLPEGYSKSDFNAIQKEYNGKKQQLSDDLKNIGQAQKEFAKAVGGK